MSTFTVPKNLLQPKIMICNQICAKKDPVEVYTHIKVHIESSVLFISALNANLFYQTSVTLATSTADCTFAIKTDMLASSIDLIDAPELELVYDETKQTLLVKGKKAKHLLRTNSNIVNDFVAPSENKENLRATIELSAKAYIEATKFAFVSVGDPKNTYQPEFCNICYSTNDEVDPKKPLFAVVSTDRFRITKFIPTTTKIEINKDNSNYKSGMVNYLLPPKSLKFVMAELDENNSVNLCFENDFAWIKSGSTTMTLSYGSGNYPDYNRIIPESFACNFVINPKELTSALKQVSLIGNLDTVNRKVRFMVDPAASEIKLISDSTNGESSESIVGIQNYEGVQESWEQAFNASFLTDYLSVVDTDELFWESNPGKPSILSPKGQKDTQLYLVSGLKS
jgi:DNA polymerase III subunit beta